MKVLDYIPDHMRELAESKMLKTAAGILVSHLTTGVWMAVSGVLWMRVWVEGWSIYGWVAIMLTVCGVMGIGSLSLWAARTYSMAVAMAAHARELDRQLEDLHREKKEARDWADGKTS